MLTTRNCRKRLESSSDKPVSPLVPAGQPGVVKQVHRCKGEHTMATELLHDLAREDQQLTVGSSVTVHWTHCGYSYKAKGVILRLERHTAEVRLLSPIGHSKDRPGFKTLSIPRFANSMEWHSSRCLRLERS
jgi:hypothetical protein